MHENRLVIENHIAASLIGRIDQVKLLIPQVSLDQIKPRRRTLLVLILVSESALLDVELEAVELTVETVGVLARALHWVVAQEEEAEVSAGERAALLIVN